MKGRKMIKHETPEHYKGNGITCEQALTSCVGAGTDMLAESAQEGARDPKIPRCAWYWMGCAFKYLWRWRLKDGRKDLLKAIDCIEYLIESVYGL